MADPSDAVAFNRAQAERIARAVELVERLDRSLFNQAPLPPMPPSDGHRPVWVVKVTGAAATSPAANVGLYPAVCRQLVYSAGTFTWTTVTEISPCWAVPAEGGFVGPGTIAVGVLYEQHKDTGAPIFVLSGPGNGSLTWRITGNNGSPSTPLYSGTLVYQTAPATWADVSPAVGVTNKIVRVPSNTPSPTAGSPDPPFIPNGQYVTTWRDPDLDGYYRITNAAGGQLGVAWDYTLCVGGVAVTKHAIATARDLKLDISTVSPPPPPPPPPAPAYYCVAGVLGWYTDPPPKFDCGPSPVRIDCATCSGTAVSPSGPLGITDATIYGDPYTVGDTVTLSLSKTGAPVGTLHWLIAVIDDEGNGGLTGAATGTGNTFGPTVRLDVAGTVEFLVMLTDDGDPTRLTLHTVSRTVNPPAVAKITSNTTLDGTHYVRPVVVNASGGNVTVKLPTANGRGYLGQYAIKRDKADVSANTVTLALNVATEKLNGTVNGTVTLAAGDSYHVGSNDLNEWDTF